MSRFESILFSLIIGECNLINPAIKTKISSDGRTLFISNVNEEDIGKLVFSSNSDDNNNKLSLVRVSVSIVTHPTLPVIVPGLVNHLQYAFNNSNSKSFRFLERVHRPFAEIPGGVGQPNRTVSQLTDILSELTAYTQPLRGQDKLYALTLTNGTTTPLGTVDMSGTEYDEEVATASAGIPYS